MSIGEIFRFSRNEERIVRTLIFLFPVFFLTIRGWSNTIAAIILIISLLRVLSSPRVYLLERDKLFWFLTLVLSFPFFAELIVQCGRGQIVGSTLDGPSRFLFASIVFIYLTRQRYEVYTPLSKGAGLSVLITCVSVLVIRDYYWGVRAATYFVDPISLPTYLLACLALASFSLLSCRRKTLSNIFTFVLFVLALVVCVLSHSRTAWVAFLVLLFVFLFFMKKNDPHYFKWAALMVIICLFLVIISSEIIWDRVSQVFDEVASFANEQGDTSTGLRLGLALMDLKLFFGHPLLGIADGSLPPIDWFSSRGMDVSEQLYRQKLLTGSHNEILAHLVRKGVLGIPVCICLFLFPLGYLLGQRKRAGLARVAGEAGFLFCIVIFVSSMTIQVFNLKMTATFFSFCLAIIFSSCCPGKKSMAG